MKAVDMPRWRIRWKGIEIGVAESASRATENMLHCIWVDLHVGNPIEDIVYDVFDAKKNIIVDSSDRYEVEINGDAKLSIDWSLTDA